MMATYGIQTQTPHEVEPVQIWPPSQLVKVYEQLGVNKKLNLRGRPQRPIGNEIYSILTHTCLAFTIFCHNYKYVFLEFHRCIRNEQGNLKLENFSITHYLRAELYSN